MRVGGQGNSAGGDGLGAVTAEAAEVGAMLAREWFAARHLGFVILPTGAVERLPGPSMGDVKRVAGLS